MNYFEIASYHRPYENNSKFELKPYSITFVVNTGENFPIYGCIDSLACNFNILATHDMIAHVFMMNQLIFHF